ncbi:MAG: terminase small subunit [Azoarcus sp.]|jgi:hypothetical protein|nr:terminase small subunit [Azoarcus sp.]
MPHAQSAVLDEPPAKLTARQAAFVDSVMEGKTPSAAAVAAGYSDQSAGASVMKSEAVQQEIARARKELTDLTLLRRLDVIEGFIDGIRVAKLMSDAGNMIRGWAEIGKMLGHYAPEVKEMKLTLTQGRIRSKLEALSDEELLAIAAGARVVNAEPPSPASLPAPNALPDT